MEIIFKKANNGEESCVAGGISLHSSYNPSREANRFVESADISFAPKFVMVTEPVLSYCAKFLRRRFPLAALCCVRYSPEFSKADDQWDKIFTAFKCSMPEIKNGKLAEEIFNYMGEDGILTCLFLSWKPSEMAFPKQNEFSWGEIKKAIIKSQSILATRTYFARRWTKNALRFSAFLRQTAIASRGNANVVVCASGPSLMECFKPLKIYRERFFLIAVSSALSPLLFNGITPDLCVSTDGGFWAKRHLEFPLRNTGIPLAIPGEGACFGENFSGTAVLPLFYGDGPSDEILRQAGYKGMVALRNGSVSGTTVQLALSMSEGRVFCVGLDLEAGRGLSHAQPNELDKIDSISDDRLATAETRSVSSNSHIGSLEIYRSWFSSTEFGGRLFRLSKGKHNFALGEIQDVDWNSFAEMTKDFKSQKMPVVLKSHLEFSVESRLEFLKNIVKENLSNSAWIGDALPVESILYNRRKGLHGESERLENIRNGMGEFYADVMRSIGGTDDLRWNN